MILTFNQGMEKVKHLTQCQATLCLQKRTKFTIMWMKKLSLSQNVTQCLFCLLCTSPAALKPSIKSLRAATLIENYKKTEIRFENTRNTATLEVYKVSLSWDEQRH